MNAAPAAQLRLLDLQAVDSALARLAHRRRTHPALAALQELDGRLANLRDDGVRAETAVSDLARAQAKAEADVDVVRMRISRDRTRLDSGQGAPRELENLQHELGSLARRQSDLEDAVLEVMEQREAAEAVLDAARNERQELAAQREQLLSRQAADFAELDAEVAAATAEREKVAGEVPADLLALYEKIRTAEGGVGAAALTRGRCDGCRLSLTPVEKSAARTAPPDAVLRCENCSRVLVRTPESGL